MMGKAPWRVGAQARKARIKKYLSKTLKNIYIWLLIQHSGFGFSSTFILKEWIGSPCIFLSIKYYWKNITPAWGVYINIWFHWNVKLEKNDVYTLEDAILMFFRLGNLRTYKLISSNHKAQKSGLQYFDEYSWIIRGAKLKVDKILLVRLT